MANIVYRQMPAPRELPQQIPRPQSGGKRPVELIKRVKIAHSFLQSVSDQFHVIILSLPM